MFILQTPHPKVVFFVYKLCIVPAWHLPDNEQDWSCCARLQEPSWRVVWSKYLVCQSVDLSVVLSSNNQDTTDQINPNRSTFSIWASSLLPTLTPWWLYMVWYQIFDSEADSKCVKICHHHLLRVLTLYCEMLRSIWSVPPIPALYLVTASGMGIVM